MLLSTMIGCTAIINGKRDVTANIENFLSPSIEVVEFSNFGARLPVSITVPSGAHSVCVVRICDVAATQPTYFDLLLAFFHNFSAVRLFVATGGTVTELKPGRCLGLPITKVMKRIEQNPVARYRKLASTIAEWLEAGDSEKLTRAIDEAATDYMFFYRPHIRVIVKSKEIYDWANEYQIPTDISGELTVSEIVTRLNEVIERETGRSNMITYRPIQSEIKMTLFLPKRTLLRDVLKTVVNMPSMIVSRARVIYEDGRVIIDHEFVDPHCCPREF